MRTKRRTVKPLQRVLRREHVMALENGLRAMEAFDSRHPALSLTEVAKRAGLTRAAARRYLHTLSALGYAEANGNQFRLAPRVLRFGYTYLSSNALPGLSQPMLERLGENLDEVASLAILEGSEVVFVARSSPRRFVSTVIGVGTRLPAFAAATGRVLLASKPREMLEGMFARTAPLKRFTPKTKLSREEVLSEIQSAREQGYALNDEEFEVGLRSIAVPVANGAGITVAAISVSAQSVRMRPAQMVVELLPVIRAAAKELEALL
jgi:IclR family transcriptional regulator, pca regulon regulatory protein